MEVFRPVPLHFRFNKKIKHNTLVGAESNRRYASLTLMHSPKNGKKKNYLLKKNPSLKDNRKSYLENRIRCFDKTTYGVSRPKLQISNFEDREYILNKFRKFTH